jgi:hypothetical protein
LKYDKIYHNYILGVYNMQLVLDIDDSPIEYVSAEEEKAINSILSTLSDEDKEVVDIREYNITL